jgi:hypothetical protein
MITGMQGLFHTPKPEEARKFIKDKLGLTGWDAGGGWLIFDIPKADLSVHPSEGTKHEICFRCENLKETVDSLKQKGVNFLSPIKDDGWGHTTRFEIPGGVEVLLFEPKQQQT